MRKKVRKKGVSNFIPADTGRSLAECVGVPGGLYGVKNKQTEGKQTEGDRRKGVKKGECISLLACWFVGLLVSLVYLFNKQNLSKSIMCTILENRIDFCIDCTCTSILGRFWGHFSTQNRPRRGPVAALAPGATPEGHFWEPPKSIPGSLWLPVTAPADSVPAF